jgi:hypothetical protein
MAVIVYRELNPDMPDHIAEWLENRGQLIWVLDKKGKEHAIVENDTPRPAEITEAIVGGEVYGPGLTIGFGVYDDEGNRIGMYASVDRAEQAAAKATVVSLESDKEFEWDSVAGNAE